MSTFAQWSAAMDRGDLRRVTWVCGEQRVLVEEVVDTTRQALGITDSSLGYASFTAGVDPEPQIWAAANQYPGVDRSLILIRDAQAIKSWYPLERWLAKAQILPAVHLLFVSAEHDLTHTTVDGKKVTAPHIADMMNRRRYATVVRCSMPNPADAVAWVRRRAKLPDDSTAEHLLVRAGGDLSAVAGLADKLALFEGRIGASVIDELCTQRPAYAFVESLLMLRKADALVQIESLPRHDYARIIGLLDLRLEFLTALNRHVRAGSGPREMSNLPHFLVRQYLPVAKHYTPQRCTYSKRVLAVVDDALHGRATDGLMEALVALW